MYYVFLLKYVVAHNKIVLTTHDSRQHFLCPQILISSNKVNKKNVHNKLNEKLCV